MASNEVLAAQFALRFDDECDDHPGEKIQRYCKTCKQMLCIDCVTSGIHSNHKLMKVEEIYLIEKRNLVRAIEDIRESDLREYTNSLHAIKHLKDSERIKKQSANVITKIKERSNEIKAAVDMIEQELIQDVVNSRDKLQTELAESEKELQNKATSTTTLLRDYEEKLKSTSLKTIINSDIHLRQAICYLDHDDNYDDDSEHGFGVNTPSDRIIQRLPDLSFERLSSKSLKQMFGGQCINDNIDINFVWEHFEYRGITGIAATSNGVWMCRLNESEVEYFAWQESLASHRFKTTFRVDDMCLSENGNILATQLGGSKVFSLGIGGMVEKLLDISPHKINGICKLRNGGFAVTITGQTNGVKMRGFIKVAVDGSKAPIRDKDSSTDKKLFTDPQKLTENVNDDICVVDGNTVTAIDREGKLRFRYSVKCGPSALADISSSSYGHIFVADYYKGVFVLSATGKFVKSFMKPLCEICSLHIESVPWTVCVGPHDLIFTGTHTGDLQVMEYK